MSFEDILEDHPPFQKCLATLAPSGTIEITENGEGIDVARYAYADVNVSGDAEIAKVTITDKLAMATVYGCWAKSDGYSEPYAIDVGTYDLLLYEGKALISSENYFDNLSGAIEYDGDLDSYVVTGDCSFSVTGSI